MSRAQPRATEKSSPEVKRTAALLGGGRVLRRELATELDVHDMIVRGMPVRALNHLMDELVHLAPGTSLEKAIGISLRTFQRHKATLSKPLSKEQGSRTWKFAEILAKATAVLGSQELAEKWLERPAMGLNRMRPIDLLETSAGVELVETYLGRIEFGVYT